TPASEAPGASLLRARKWLGPRLLRTLDRSPTEPAKPALQWADWARAGARVDAFTFASGERAPGATGGDVQQFKIGIEQT
ncbi:hypothetical protein K4H02_27255, partial [Mycobacterium tuberculosis]|nr:hypothetical protein [Mycobacterium tuberculosis]